MIRVGPNTLHINDPEVYQDMTKVGSRFIKDPDFYNLIMLPNTSIGETDPGRHRIRRQVLSPAFSTRRVQELSPMIESKVEKLMSRFENFAAARTPVNLFNASNAFTMDIISKMVLGEEIGCLDDPNFRNEFIEHLHAAFEMGWTEPTFPNMTKISLSLPPYLQERIFPIPVVEFKKVNETSLSIRTD